MTEAATSQPRRPVRRLIEVLTLGPAIVAFLLRITVRDRFPGLAIVYYVMPWAVLLLIAVGGAAAATSPRRRTIGFAISAVAVCGWIGSEWRMNPADGFSDGVRVVFWNLQRGAGGWDRVIADLQGEQADLIGLVESTPPAQSDAWWKNRFPDYDIVRLRGGMTILVRGRVVGHTSHPLSDHARGLANRVVVLMDQEEWIVWIVDIVSTPWLSRGPALRSLTEKVLADADRRTLVMGDFNTPAGSAHLDAMRIRFANAFEQVGMGYACTWPQPFPVLTLDQVWCSGKIRLGRCEHVANTASDHRRVRASFYVTTSQPEP